jgi:hypothetical protein
MDAGRTPLPASLLPAADNAAISGEAEEPAEAQEPVVPTTPPPPVPLPDADRGGATDNTWLDRIHTYFERSMYQSSDWFDRALGGEQVQVSERARSSLWWKNDFAYFQNSDFEYRTTFRASIWLPRLKNRWRLVIAGENQGDPTVAIPVDPGNPGTNVQSTQRAASAELVYDLFRTKKAILSVGAGVKLAISTDAFGRVRLGYEQPLRTDLLGRFVATAYYNVDAPNGESNQLSFEWRLSPAVMLVWANSATIEEGSNGWNWGTDLVLGYAISPSSAFTLGTSATWSTRPDWEVQNYRVYTGYRRSILRPWLFCELIPEVDWPLQSDGSRDTVWGVRLRLEILFVGKELYYSEN